MKNTAWINKLSGLIRSMTQAQKRDFKKYVKFWGQKNEAERKYILLFDAVHRFQKFAKKEEDLSSHLLKQKKLGQSPKVITNSAQYLYRKILESMRTTPDASPHLNQLNSVVQDIIFMYSKSLFEDCQEFITRSRSLAYNLDKPALGMELNFWEYRLNDWTGEYFNAETLKEWLNAQKQLLAELTEKVEYDVLAAEMRILLRKKEDLPGALENRIQNLLAEHEKGLTTQLTIGARIRLLSTFSDYFDLKSMVSKGKTPDGPVKRANLERSMHFQGLVLEAYRQNKIFAEEEQLNYVIIMDRYLNRCLRNGRADLAERLEAEWANEKNELIEFRNIAYYRMQRHLALNEFRKACEYFEKNEVAAGIEKYKYRMPENRLLALQFTAGQVYYALDNYEKAVDWFREVADMKMEVRPDAVLVCKVLEIICLWEFGAYKNNPDPIRPVRNLRRALIRAKLMNLFLTKILDAIEMVFRNPRGLVKSGFPLLLSDVKNDYEADKTKALFSMVLAWFDAKLHRTSVNREIIKY